MATWLIRNWFLIGLAAVLVAAWLLPAPAAAAAWPGHLKLALIAAIFCCSGLALRSEELVRGLGAWRLHLLIQGLSLVVTPLICLGLDAVWRSVGLDPGLRLGLLVLGALPTTVTSCVALTMAVDGNRAAALVNATLGNLLGLVITPLWLMGVTAGSQAAIDFGSVLSKLGLVVLLPVLVGQLLRLPLRRQLTATASRRLGQFSLALLLGILLLVFVRAADQHPPAATVATCLLIVGGLHVLWLALPWWLGRLAWFGLTTADRHCALFCASQKTLALGVPLIAICFAGHPALATITLPILCYHPLQLIIAALLVGRLAPASKPS